MGSPEWGRCQIGTPPRRPPQSSNPLYSLTYQGCMSPYAYQPDVPLLLAILRRHGSGAPRTQVDICGLGAGRHDR